MRLEITRKTDLATRANAGISAFWHARPKASVLADAVGTTTGFLSQVMTPLVARGGHDLTQPTGGYTCTIDIQTISILDIIEAIEGATDTTHCVLIDRDCSEAHPCALHGR
jgi:DNA-binding IscR family transcriptional regulator